MATLTDAFTRANTTPGGGLGTLPNGPVWQSLSGNWYISGNAAAQDSAANAIAAVALGAFDADLAVDVVSGGLDSSAGLAFRVVDASNYLALRAGFVSNGGVYQQTTVTLTKVVAGVASQLAYYEVGTPQNTGIRVVLAGTTIAVYARGVLRGSVIDSTHGSATKHGVIKNVTPFGGGQASLDNFVVTYNTPPNAPTLVSPAGGVSLDAAAGQRLDWDFSDNDFGDLQSAYDLRYRIVGASSWTTVNASSAASHRDFAAGFFAVGNYEWQVRTYDTAGLVGPYSGSEFFSIIAAPPGPSITSPSNGSTVSAETATVTWSTPDQDAYHLRTVADAAGSPNTGTVYTDTGTVESPTAVRSRSVAFAVNNRTEHIQLRVRVDGLWSPWASVLVNVSYTAPAVPTVTLTTNDATGSITALLASPAPSGGQPSVIGYDLQRRESLVGGDGIRIAADAPAGPTVDYTPASGVEYDYRVRAYGDNGTSSYSAWTSAVEGAAFGTSSFGTAPFGGSA